jgi:hypothetical protein
MSNADLIARADRWLIDPVNHDAHALVNDLRAAIIALAQENGQGKMIDDPDEYVVTSVLLPWGDVAEIVVRRATNEPFLRTGRVNMIALEVPNPNQAIGYTRIGGPTRSSLMWRG